MGSDGCTTFTSVASSIMVDSICFENTEAYIAKLDRYIARVVPCCFFKAFWDSHSTVDVKVKGQGVCIFQNSTPVLFCKIESVCALVSLNCFSNNTTFALLFWSPIEGQCQLTRFCFGERLCTLYIFPWKIFAYEHSYDMEFLVHSNLELHCCIYSSHSQSEGCAYSCIFYSVADLSFHCSKPISY